MCFLLSFWRKRRARDFLNRSIIREAEYKSGVFLVEMILSELRERGISARNCVSDFLVLRYYKEHYSTRDLGISILNENGVEIKTFVLMRCSADEHELCEGLNRQLKTSQ